MNQPIKIQLKSRILTCQIIRKLYYKTLGTSKTTQCPSLPEYIRLREYLHVRLGIATVQGQWTVYYYCTTFVRKSQLCMVMSYTCLWAKALPLL